MCRVTQSNLETDSFQKTNKMEGSNMAISQDAPNQRKFAAASVPHLDWHVLKHLRKTGQHSGQVGPSPATPGPGTTASGIGSPAEPQTVRRKDQSLVQTEEPPSSTTITSQTVAKQKTSFFQAQRHSYNNSCSSEVTPFQRSIASGVGTVFMTLAMNPLDVVKVRLQSQEKFFSKDPGLVRNPTTLSKHPEAINGIHRSINTTSGNNGSGAAMKYNGTLDAFRKIIRMEGVKRLWSGMPPALLMRIPANMVYFTVYDGLKTQLGFQSSHPSDLHSVLVTIFASGCARTMSITLVNPLDLVRTKLQSQSMTYADLGGRIRSGVKAEGVFSLWRGLGSTILRDVPFAILYWSNYELLKTQLMKLGNVTEATVAMTFSAGVISGVFSSIVTTPFDVVKTNKQIAIGEAEGACTRQSTWRMMQQIKAQAGVRGLFAGVVPRVAMSAPASAILITCYEATLSMFRHYNAANASMPGRLT